MLGGGASGKDDSSEQWLDSGYTWKVETTGFPGRLDVGCEGEKDELKLDPNFSHMCCWKNSSCLLGRNNPRFILVHVEFEVSIRQSSGNVN